MRFFLALNGVMMVLFLVASSLAENQGWAWKFEFEASFACVVAALVFGLLGAWMELKLEVRNWRLRMLVRLLHAGGCAAMTGSLIFAILPFPLPMGAAVLPLALAGNPFWKELFYYHFPKKSVSH